jgi:hypothetical protein
VDGEGRLLAEDVGELLDFGGPGTLVAGEVEGIADEDFGDFVLADEAEEAAEVFASGFTPEGEEGLGCLKHWVGDGEADAGLADVECEDAGDGHGVSARGRRMDDNERGSSRSETN